MPVDKPRSNCAVVGVYGHPQAAKMVYSSLYALQHRGQESSGIVTSDGRHLHRHVDMGLVTNVFSDAAIFDKLPGELAIGHNRYSTTGSTVLHNAQPFVVSTKHGLMAISHNGNFVNSRMLRNKLEDEGSIFQTTSDTEVVFHLMAKSPAEDIVGRLKDAFRQLKGAYSLVILTRSKLIAVRDPRGWRPLNIGRKGEAWFIASETCAFDLVEAQYVREVEPGEIVVINHNGMHSDFLDEKAGRSACIFEFVYFSRPDSKIFDENVDRARRRLGKNLANEHPAEADIVIAVPDSSNTAALGYARNSGIKYEIGLIRNHYIGRTFIHPDQSGRDFNVRIKFNPVKGVLNGRRVVMVEDSIVRGTTVRHLVRLLRKADVKEVHVRVSSPPIISPCYYGMDFPTKSELIAANKTVEEIKNYLEVDSLEYLSIEGLLKSVPHEKGGYCTACFTGEYPIPPEEEMHKFTHDLNNGNAGETTGAVKDE
ncbi:MAG: amidophosphoribosyltransferase [candidate division KSB1 bacterium]|nr:amidophosphoribosyltransferase [candidate division KSB1 bacterium]MDZ7312791.1 amidophosphoribosyltransferase [candidate division KSB1 bacterium]